jgi:hypothetical protein
MSGNHPTVRLPIKTADIDVEMVPVVRWLNSFANVTTHFCCQGDDRPGMNPYVMFTCHSPVQLIRVLTRLENYATVEIHWYEASLSVRYTARFGNREMLDSFVLGLPTWCRADAAEFDRVV